MATTTTTIAATTAYCDYDYEHDDYCYYDGGDGQYWQCKRYSHY